MVTNRTEIIRMQLYEIIAPDHFDIFIFAPEPDAAAAMYAGLRGVLGGQDTKFEVTEVLPTDEELSVSHYHEAVTRGESGFGAYSLEHGWTITQWPDDLLGEPANWGFRRRSADDGVS
jgi:hypothetical protein